MSTLYPAPVRVSVESTRRVTEVAPTTSNLRKYPLPIFDTRPRRSLSLDEPPLNQTDANLSAVDLSFRHELYPKVYPRSASHKIY
jgi:hypothetical protein